MNRLASLLLALLLATTLSACANNHGLSPLNSKSLTTYNYNAVDTLMSKAGRAVSKEAPMLVATIADVNNVESSSTLGRTITEQVSSRLAQKGYRVAEMKLRNGISITQGGVDSSYSGEYLLSRDVRNVSGEHKAAAAITGTYSVGARTVLVNLRLIDIRTGNVITAYDYSVPQDADIATMTHGYTLEKNSFFSTGWDN